MARKRKRGTLFGRPRSDVVRHPGAFTASARPGESTGAHISRVLAAGSRASPKEKRRAALAKAFRTMRRRRGHRR